MTTAAYVARYVLPAAFALLPDRLDSPEARGQVMAIGMHESKFLVRRQYQGGPARGFWQFERDGGVKGVLRHDASHFLAESVLAVLGYSALATPAEIHAALEHNDVLAAAFARLLLWTDPHPLPLSGDRDAGWALYQSAWRPGKPRVTDWPSDFTEGWNSLDGERKA